MATRHESAVTFMTIDSLANNESNPKATTLMPCIAEVLERCLFYYEYDSGRKIRHKLNFDSPHTSEAALQLGVSFNDCIPR